MDRFDNMPVAYTLPHLPQQYVKVYKQAAKFVSLIASKTPKVQESKHFINFLVFWFCCGRLLWFFCPLSFPHLSLSPRFCITLHVAKQCSWKASQTLSVTSTATHRACITLLKPKNGKYFLGTSPIYPRLKICCY